MTTQIHPPLFNGNGIRNRLSMRPLDLLRQSGESLAGRIAFVELDPLSVLEVGSQPRLIRNGFGFEADFRIVFWRGMIGKA